MRDYVIAPALALLLHLALVLAIGPYARLMAGVGGVLVRGNDVADLPDMVFAGAAMAGLVWIALAVGAVAIARRSR